MRTKRNLTDPLLYIAILFNVVVHHLWFFSTAILTYGDAGYNFPQQLGQIASFQTWSLDSLGGITAVPSAYPFIYLAGLLSRAGFPMPIVQRILLFWPMVIVGSLGSYLLVKKVSGSRVGGMVGSIVFNFNTFFVVSTSMHITIATAISFFPLVLYLYLELVEKPSLWRALGCTVPLFIISFLDFRVFYVCLLPLVLLFPFSLAEGRERRDLAGYTALFFLPMLATILFNSYWLVPYYLGGLEASTQGVTVGRALFTGGTTGTNLLHNAYAVFHPMWSGGKLEAFSIHPIPFYWFLVPVLAFSALLPGKLRRDGRVLFFALVALVGIFLTKFFFPPFPGAYQWLYDHFPGFNAFRDPGKFTFLVYLPYAVLIGCLVGYLLRRARGRGWRTAAVLCLAALVCLPFVLNAVPVATGSAGALFVARDLPDDYVVFKDFVLAQPGPFRTLWVPTFSRWSFYDDGHPHVGCVDALTSAWKDLQDPDRSDYSDPDNILDILERPFAPELLASASIAYVLVPLQDTQNDDDFFAYYGGDRQAFIDGLDGLDYLERVDIGTQELAVYRTKGYQPALFAPPGICRLDPAGDIDPQYLLARSLWGADLPFTRDDDGGAAAISVTDLLATEGDMRIEAPAPDGGETLSLYADRGRGDLRCLLAGGTITLSRVYASVLLMDGEPLDGSLDGREVLRTLPVGPGGDCWLEADGVWFRLEEGKELDLGRMDRISSLRLYRTDGGNLIPNGSFEEGLWREEVEDYDEYDDRPMLGMRLNGEEASDGTFSLQLEAARHTAGTYTTFAVQGGGRYVLSFDYQSPNAREAGYHLEFDDAANTVISEVLPVIWTGWQPFQRGITVPRGATSATLYVYAYEPDVMPIAVNRYDHCEFRPLEFDADLGIVEFHDRLDGLIPVMDEGEYEFEILNGETSHGNLISNGSFEEGLWGEEVVDCSAYDDRPILGMRLSDEEASDGRYSLQLEATRHTAGTYTVFPVEGNRDYTFEFDYQSPNATNAGYYFHFNDGAQTTISEVVPISGTQWQHFQRRLTTPLGASVATLYVYSYPSDDRTNVVTRYDGFEFTEMPPGPGLYYLANTADAAPAETAALEVTGSGPTRVDAKIGMGAAPSVLAFGRKYDPGWSLAEGPGSGGYFSLDGDLSAWYLEPQDGEEASDLVLEFYPQRKVPWGSLLSILTFLGLMALALGKILWDRQGKKRRGMGMKTASIDEGRGP